MSARTPCTMPKRALVSPKRKTERLIGTLLPAALDSQVRSGARHLAGESYLVFQFKLGSSNRGARHSHRASDPV